MFVLTKLVKNDIVGLLNLNNLFDNNKGKVKNPVIVSLGAIVFAAIIMGVSASYSYSLAQILIQVRAMHVMPTAIFVAGSMAVFFYCAMRSASTLFKFDDYDLLASMPIKSSTIITSKLIYLYISDLVFSLLFILPSIAVWWYYERPDIAVVVCVLLALPFMPFIPIVIATIVGTIVSYLTSFTKHKTFISIVANLALIFGILIFSNKMATSSVEGNMQNIALAMQSQLMGQYPPARFFFNLTQGDFISLLWFILISIIPAIIFVIVVAKMFKKLHTSLESTAVKKSTAKLSYTDNGAFKALITKEAKRFFASSVYVINSGLGVILGLMAIIYLAFFGRDYLAIMLNNEEMKNALVSFMPLIAACFGALTCTTACSISLEGRNLWIIKHLPVSAYQIFMSKVCFNLILTLPLSVVASIFMGFVFKLTILQFAATLAVACSSCFFISYLGLVLNIAFPKFNWNSETKVVKQSAPTGLVLFAAMAVLGMTFLLVQFVFDRENAYFVYLALAALMCLASFLMDRNLRNNGQEILLNLDRYIPVFNHELKIK